MTTRELLIDKDRFDAERLSKWILRKQMYRIRAFLNRSNYLFFNPILYKKVIL